MTKKISVLVADDSALMRRMISDMINLEADMEVIDTAKNGQDLLDKLTNVTPDVITLDIEMPKMNGIEALKKIVELKIPSKVIMLSSLSQEGTSVTMECLENGAVDFVPKPSGSISLNITEVKEMLASKIRQAKMSRNVVPRLRTIEKKEIDIHKPVEKRPTRNSSISKKIDAVVIGASTGGPKALQAVITKLPKDLNVPVLVVQHMPQGFTKAFAERLDRYSEMHVVEAAEGMNVEKGTVYIAPGGSHMEVRSNKIVLTSEPPIWGVRPAVDKLFVSASKCYKSNLLGVILTGMGRDGADGVVAVKKQGGYNISEDESTCVIYGMPKAAYETNMVDEVVPLYDVSKRISNIVLGKGSK